LAVAAESFPVAVSPSPLGEGIAVVAVRGRTPGVLLVGTDDSAPVTVLSDVDPWCVITRGEQVWVGTLGQGLWVSNDGGLTFTEAVPGASVPALDIVGETLLMGLRDGSVLAPVTGATMGTVAPGWAIDFASAGDELLVLSASTDGPERLWRGDGSSLSPVALPSVDDDPGLDLSDEDGAGPEIVNLHIPEDVVYKVGVHYWEDWDYGDSYATVRVYSFEELIFEGGHPP